MNYLPAILLVFSFVIFVLAAFWQPNPPRVNLIALGLAFFAAYFLFGAWHR